MAVIQWWLLQMDDADVDEFTRRYTDYYWNGGITADDAIDESGKSILSDAGVIPGERYLWPEPDWAAAEKVKYDERN